MPAFGFSYMGALYIALLLVPNLLAAKRLPSGLSALSQNENRILLAFERIGQILLVCCALIFSGGTLRPVFLIAALLAMLLYELYWVRYLKSGRTMTDFYHPLLFIPLPGAVLPVLAALLLSAGNSNPFLSVAGLIFGIGHISIHFIHHKEVKNKKL